MTEGLRDDLEWHALGEKKRGRAVAELVGCPVAEAGLLRQAGEGLAGQPLIPAPGQELLDDLVASVLAGTPA